MDRPAKVLASVPVVDSIEQCEIALAELAWLDNESRRVNAEFDGRVAALRTKHEEEKLSFGPARKRVKFAERWKQLTDVVTEFARGARDKLLEGLKGKSREFTHGSIVFAEQRERIGSARQDSTVDEVTRAFLEKTQIVAGVRKFLEKVQITFADGSTISADKVLSVDFAFSLTRINDEKKKGTLSAVKLGEMDLAIVRPEEKITIKVGA